MTALLSRDAAREPPADRQPKTLTDLLLEPPRCPSDKLRTAAVQHENGDRVYPQDLLDPRHNAWHQLTSFRAAPNRDRRETSNRRK